MTSPCSLDAKSPTQVYFRSTRPRNNIRHARVVYDPICQEEGYQPCSRVLLLLLKHTIHRWQEICHRFFNQPKDTEQSAFMP
ncbi:hypothetical protein VTJ04DRAFT_10511 [Mycothermus thermophilus]|uniref:uncharacterized protein n=1 Tax=Humicola insolens TaxID=85995 RepID=UPI0037437BEC